MNTLRSLWLQLVALGPLFVLAQCYGQGTFTRITFDGPPVQAPGTATFVQEYYESAVWFRPLGVVGPGKGFGRVGSNPTPRRPSDGTAYLQGTLGDSLKFSFTNDSVFDLVSVDLAEYSTVVPDAVTVHFVGYRHDGSIVTSDLTTDGIIDGTGPLADFQTFTFGPQFTGLDRVEIPSYGWSLDNLVLSIPEPGTGALAMAGGVLLGVRFLKRKPRP